MAEQLKIIPLGGLLEIGAMTGAGVRRIRFPNGVRELRLLTGQKIVRRGKDFIDVDLPYKDAAIFKMIRENRLSNKEDLP